MEGEFLHAGLVAEDAPFGAFGGGIDGEYGEFASVAEHVEAEDVDGGGFAGSRHSRNAYAAAVAAVGEAFFDNLLCEGLMLWCNALYERDGTRQARDVAFENSLHEVGGRREGRAAARLQVWVDGRWLGNAGVNCKAGEFGGVFRMAVGGSHRMGGIGWRSGAIGSKGLTRRRLVLLARARRHGVVARAAPWVAAEDSPDGQP